MPSLFNAPRNAPDNRKTEAGNVLVYLLVAVALIGALSFAITRTSSDGGDISSERAKVVATDLIEYTNILANATGQLRLRGCTLAQLNFDHADLTGYDNTSAPDDGTCDIFHLNGGGVQYTAPPVDGVNVTDLDNNVWGFYGDNTINQVGTDCTSAACTDLIAAAQYIRKDVCMKVNDLLGIENLDDAPPSDTHLDTAKFTGTMGYSVQIADEAGGEALITRRAGCYSKTGGTPTYVFYKVLQAR